MRKTTLLLSVAVAATLPLPSLAQQGQQTVVTSPGKGTITETVKVTATVEAIDKAKRTVTLKGASGKSETITVGPEARNFDQVKVGDKVTVEYVQALSLELKKASGQKAEVTTSSGVVRSEPGQKPGGAVGAQVTALTDVVDLDPARQVVVLKGPQGNLVDLKVRDPEQFKLVKKGDQVQVTYTEAMAVAVTPAK
jgi:hypothetical protein